MRVDPLQKIRLQKRVEQAHQDMVSGNLVDAESSFKEILLETPDYSEAMHGLGVLYLAQGKYDVAEPWLRKAVEAEPENPVNWNDLGELLRSIGRIDEAVEAYKRAIDLAPEMTAVINNLAVGLAGQGKTEEAKAYFYKAIDIDPNDPHPYNNLGVLLENVGESDEALICYEKAVMSKYDFGEAKQNYVDLLQRHPDKLLESMGRLLKEAKTYLK